MKLLKLILSLTAGVCAVCTVHAQSTNVGTFTATMTIQGPDVSVGNTETAATISSTLNTAGLIAELGRATTNSFSRTAKLEVINGSSSQFAVSDGANFVLIPTNIVSINPTTGNSVISGKLTSTSLHEKQLMVFEMDFNDVGTAGSDLKFSLRGIGSITTTETATSTSTSAKITLVGGGTLGAGNTNFVATATLSGSGN